MLLLFSLLGPTFTCHTASVWPLDQDGVGALETMALPARNGERSMREVLTTLSLHSKYPYKLLKHRDYLWALLRDQDRRGRGGNRSQNSERAKAAGGERVPLAGGSPELQCASMECFLKIPAAVLAPSPLSTVVQTGPRMYDLFNKRLKTK